MKAAPQELLKEYMKTQKFTSTAEIMAAMKEMFQDVGGMEEKILGSLRLWDESAGYRRTNQGAVRCRDFSRVGNKDYGKNDAGSYCVAESSSGGGVSPEPFTALHRPSDSFLHPLCQLEGYQAGGG